MQYYIGTKLILMPSNHKFGQELFAVAQELCRFAQVLCVDLLRIF